MTRLAATIVGFAIVGIAHPAEAQQAAETVRHAGVSGVVSITNNGTSLIPTFSLGRPAATLDVAVRKGNLSFEPQFKFGLDGTPWTAVFWWRHKPLRGEKLQLTVGAHPAFVFRKVTTSTNGRTSDALEAKRFLAGEVSPSYSVAENVSVGAHYLYSYALEKDAVKHIHFVAARAGLTNVRLSDRYFMQVAPQVYHLRVGDQHGLYVSSGVTLGRRNAPLSLSTMVNQPIRTRIVGGKNFVWSVSVNYAIG